MSALTPGADALERIKRAVERELALTGADVLGRSQRDAPIETGELRASGYTEMHGFGAGHEAYVEVGFTAPHAVAQHEKRIVREAPTIVSVRAHARAGTQGVRAHERVLPPGVTRLGTRTGKPRYLGDNVKATRLGERLRDAQRRAVESRD